MQHFPFIQRLSFLAITLSGPIFAQPAHPIPGQLWRDPVSGMDFCYCPPGTFAMGSAEADPYRVSDQLPQHAVTISRGFWLGRTEVTQASWQAWMGSNPSSNQRESLPVETVSWEDCQGLLQKLNAAAGSSVYRLPTEAEWEYACHADSPDPTEADLSAFAWYRWGVYAYPRAAVGQLRPNAWGLFDMLGNMREWCSDWRGPYPASSQADPQGPASGTYRINRGGSWQCRAVYVRRVYRWYYTPDFRADDLGFRVLRISGE